MRAIPSFESHTVEFKSQWREKDGQTIKKTLAAFANTAGGEIYIGVNDDGTVCGLENIQTVEESLYSFVRDGIYPSISSMVTTERLFIR